MFGFRRSRLLGLAAVALLLCAPLPGQNAAPRPVSEEEVKAAFFFNFLRFVDWPAAEANREDRLTVCIAGSGPVGAAVEKALDGETIQGRQIQIRRVRRWQRDCRALFVGTSPLSESQMLAGIDPGVLTVGEGDNFLREGGIIALVVEQDRVRFDVNLRAAQRNAVALRTQLLEVARRVER